MSRGRLAGGRGMSSAKRRKSRGTDSWLLRLSAMPAKRSVVPALRAYSCLLLVGVDRLADKAYGAELARWMSEKTGMPANEGQVTGTLRRLERDLFLTSRKEPGPTGGHPVVVYTISDFGHSALATALKRLLDIDDQDDNNNVT